MRIKIISVGKKNDALFDKAIELYSNRLKHFTAIKWDFVKPSGLGQDRAPNLEAQQILAHLSSNETVWLLDGAGKQIETHPLYLASYKTLRMAEQTN